MPELFNPLLLQVKWFLADFTWIRRQEYQSPFSVCTHFTMETVIAATQQEIRCAAALISFDYQISHAIVAFVTDYGIIFIEPQNGEQAYIEINKKYPTALTEIPEESRIVKDIRLLWNDDPHLKWLTCQDCGYVLPTRSIIDICLMCHSTNTKLETNSRRC